MSIKELNKIALAKDLEKKANWFRLEMALREIVSIRVNEWGAKFLDECRKSAESGEFSKRFHSDEIWEPYTRSNDCNKAANDCLPIPDKMISDLADSVLDRELKDWLARIGGCGRNLKAQGSGFILDWTYLEVPSETVDPF